MNNKICSKCKILKSIEYFGVDKRNKDKLTHHCKDCIRTQYAHKCISCDNLVYKKYALRCRNCANRYILAIRDTSFFKSKRYCKLRSELAKKRLKNSENHPNYKDGRTLGKVKCKDCGASISYASAINGGRCKKCNGKILGQKQTGQNNHMWKGGKPKCLSCGKSIAHNANYCNQCYQKKLKGKNNPNWRGGIAYLPYSSEWSEELKSKIRERDNYTCMICGKIEKIGLSVHHIDYDKLNCKFDNLITLCKSCHGKTNGNRKYWFEYCTQLMIERYYEIKE